MFGFMKKMSKLLPKEATLPGRAERMRVPETHFVNGNRIMPPFPSGMALAQFGMGCFWGAERVFWQTPGNVQNFRSAPQKQPMPKTAFSNPAGNGPSIGVCNTVCSITSAPSDRMPATVR